MWAEAIIIVGHYRYWFAWIVALPVWAEWGASKDEAITFVTQTARAYVCRLRDTGVAVPERVETSNTPVVAVTL